MYYHRVDLIIQVTFCRPKCLTLVSTLKLLTLKPLTIFIQADLLSQSSLSSAQSNEINEGDELREIFDERLELLNQVCRKYSNPLRGESQGLLSLPIDEPRCRFNTNFGLVTVIRTVLESNYGKPYFCFFVSL